MFKNFREKRQYKRMEKLMNSEDYLEFQRYMDADIERDKKKAEIINYLDKMKDACYDIISVCDTNNGKPEFINKLAHDNIMWLDEIKPKIQSLH